MRLRTGPGLEGSIHRCSHAVSEAAGPCFLGNGRVELYSIGCHAPIPSAKNLAQLLAQAVGDKRVVFSIFHRRLVLFHGWPFYGYSSAPSWGGTVIGPGIGMAVTTEAWPM